MKKILLIILGLCLLINLTGCYNYQEIQRFATITAIAVDKGKEKKYAITSEVLTYEMGKEGKLKPVLVEMEGDTLFEAMRKMISIFSKRMYVGHCRAVIVSEDLAKEGIFEILDAMLREHDFRSTVSLFMTRGSEAKEMLKDTALYFEIAGYEIERLGFNDSQSLGFGRVIFLYQAANSMLSEGIEMTLPVLELKDTEKGKTFVLKGVGLFKDEKLIGFLEDEELMFFLSLLNELDNGVTSVELDNGVWVSYELLYGKTKTKVYPKKDNFKFEVKFKVSFYIQSISHDKNDRPYNLSDKQAEELLEKHWKEKTMEVFEKLKSINTDVLNYGRLIMGKDFKLWKSIQDKEEILQHVELDFHVEATLLGEGRRK